MARNRYFNQYGTASEQNVYEDLIIESIKIYGIDAYYIPRTSGYVDQIYAEDRLSLFDDAIALELFVKSYDGFIGQEDFLSKFGLQIDEQINFVVSQKRFTQSLKTSLLTEYGYNLITEDGNQLLYDVSDAWDYSSILRPREGDLIWIPMMGYMYEIKFTENIENFFPLGKLYTYEMRCDRYEYSSERIDTDVADIDAVEDDFSESTSIIDNILLEDAEALLLEDGTILLTEGEHIKTVEAESDNDYITDRIRDDDIIDFSESNPFSMVREY
jgi:hypothetical protein